MVREMDPSSDEHVLDVLRSFASGALFSVGKGITVLWWPRADRGRDRR
jgi:hypothetical protein